MSTPKGNNPDPATVPDRDQAVGRAHGAVEELPARSTWPPTTR